MDNAKTSPAEVLFPAIPGVTITSIVVTGVVVKVAARETSPGACCPGCGQWSTQAHASYLRYLTDLPTGGRPVVLTLTVRRFLCAAAGCPRQTFVEQARASRAAIVDGPSDCEQCWPHSGSPWLAGPALDSPGGWGSQRAGARYYGWS
jgi:transposase